MSIDPSLSENHPLHLGRYKVLSHIATGGMATVYRARDIVEVKDVALKVLAPRWAEKPHILARFRREARLGKLLHHEHVVAYLDSGEDQGAHFLAMEYVSGIDLQQYINNKQQLEASEAWYFMLQAARALDHLYGHQIVHRDIKPANFLITLRDKQPFLQLIDLGLARRLGEESIIVAPGTTVGSIDYIAPEQVQDRNAADIRSDIYALGCTWYHMLAGRPPFAAVALQDRLSERLVADPPDVRRLNPDVPQPMVEVLDRMLSRNQSFRYPAPADLLHDLEALNVSTSFSKPRPDRSARKLDESRARRGFWLVLGLLLGAVLAGTMIWLALRETGATEP